jgi:hypothetical protein
MSDLDFARDLDVIAGRQIADATALKAIYQSGGNPNNYNCDDDPVNLVEVVYTRGSCIAIWEGRTSVNIAIPGTQQVILVSGELGGISYITTIELAISIDEPIFATVACGDGCCKLTRTYCNNDGALQSSEKAEAANPSGEVCSFVVPDPPIFWEQDVNWISSSPCFTPCNDLPSGNKIVKNVTKQSKLMSFKNPTNGELLVNLAVDIEATIEILTVEGRIEKKQTIRGDRSILFNLTDIPVGVYYVKLTQANGLIETQKLISQ